MSVIKWGLSLNFTWSCEPAISQGAIYDADDVEMRSLLAHLFHDTIKQFKILSFAVTTKIDILRIATRKNQGA